jgi:hypothetical protein
MLVVDYLGVVMYNQCMENIRLTNGTETFMLGSMKPFLQKWAAEAWLIEHMAGPSSVLVVEGPTAWVSEHIARFRWGGGELAFWGRA